jgi:hypothetical protein
VNLSYNPKDRNYSVDGLGQGRLIQEIVTMRTLIPERTPEEWSKFVHNVGSWPVYIVANHVDIWHMLLYGVEVLRQNPEFRDSGLSETQKTYALRHPEFDKDKWQEKIDGTIWGGVPMEDPQYLSFKKPVREQVEEKAKAQIESHREEAPASTMQHEETAYGQQSAEEALWVQAEKLARKGRDEWEGKVDFEMEQRVKYCYGWLRDIGEVPPEKPTRVELFWPRPMPGSIPLDEKSVMRRSYITGKVIRFWQKSMASVDNRDEMLLTNPLSYRVVLAAKSLSRLIEAYATNWQTDEDGANDESLQKKVKRAALKYFQAHFPIAQAGGSPGPIATQDPDYVEYLRLCRQYEIKPGTFLHDLDL